MKKLVGIVAVLFLAAGAFAATSATDAVGVSSEESGMVILLGLAGGGSAQLHARGAWGQTVPGARATLEQVTDSRSSGRLVYTVH